MKQAPFSEKLLDMAMKRRGAMPPALADAPSVWPWLRVFYTAFWNLINDRFSDNGLIPWSVREDWANRHGLDEEARDLLHRHVVAMDIAYTKWLREKQAESRQRPDKEPAKDPSRG